jgi:hypothetical protein
LSESIDATTIASTENENRPAKANAAKSRKRKDGKSRKKRSQHKPRHIPLPDGNELWPRRELANKVFGITERTAQNHKWPVTYIANVAYSPYREVIALMAGRIRYAPEPVKAKRGRRR